MNTKKLLALGTCVSALSMFVACSDDSSVTPPVVSSSSSSTIVPNSSSDIPTYSSSDIVANSSSSGVAPVPESSSSSSEDVLDSSFTNMGVSEIMYNAPDGSALEWIEVYIKKGPDIADMQLSNLRLDGAVSFSFPTGSLKKGEYVIVTNDVAKFKATYPNIPATCRIFGPWDNDSKTGSVAKLVNEGDVVDVKLRGEGDVSAAFSNNPPWPSLANGNGRTLVYRGGNEADPTSWGASVAVNGNPCSGDDQAVDASTVRLNEIKPYALGVSDGWVELYNSGAAPVDVAGWELVSKRKNDGKGKTWKIGGTNTVVPAKGFLLLEATAAVFGEGLFLSDNGDEIYLYETVGGARTGQESSLLISAGKQSSGVVEVAGTVAQGAMAAETPGSANSVLKAGPIFISEIHYHEDENNPNDLEFLELVNTGTTPVTLAETVNNTPHGWKVEGVNLEFAATDVIPAGGKMVLFNDSLQAKEAVLRARYTIPETVPVRFYAGKLSNRGETVAVKKPYSYVENGGVKQWYYEISDATLYSDRWTGMTETDGKGKSLNRKDFTTTGYGYTAWEAKAPTPGK